jgi:hypothetical protein
MFIISYFSLNEALYSASRISQFDHNFCIASILDILQTFSRQLELTCMWLLIFLIYCFPPPSGLEWLGTCDRELKVFTLEYRSHPW